MDNKIKVISEFNGRCVVENHDLHISRVWPARGAVVTFTKEQIEELMFDPAFSNMVKEGYLYIEDMEVKKEIGIEPEDAEKPTNILLSDKELKRFWKDMPFAQFKIEVKNLKKIQLDSLAEYAIRNGDEGSIDKANYLSKISGYQILKGIEIEKQSKEV